MYTRARLAAAATITALTLAACSSGSTVTDTPKVSTSSKDTATAAPAEETPAAPKVAKVGDTIALTGMEDGSSLDVTLVKVADPASTT